MPATTREWIAVDLLSQAEHDTRAQSVLITDDAAFADAVAAAVERGAGAPAAGRDRRRRAGATRAAVIVVSALDDAAALVDRLAPEHLELAVADPDRLADRVRHAGAIFLGRHAPEAIGDYVAGPQPCAADGAQRPLRQRPQRVRLRQAHHAGACDAAGLARMGPAAVRLARAEG